MLNSSKVERKLAAIMFTDIAGFTALASNDEQSALDLLQKQREVIFPIIKSYNGILHKELGDGLLISFNLTSESVKCAIEIQKSIKKIEDLKLRIGIHEGEIAISGDDVLGDDVNVAARIEPFSAVGGVSISGKVQQNISSLPEFKTLYLGKPELKGVAQEVKVYCITSHSQAVREYSNDPVLADILVTNYVTAELTSRQRAMLDYAWKMTANVAETGDDERQTLIEEGFTPEEIFDINDVVAYFNYTNRMTHGLGIQPNEIYFSMDRLDETKNKN